MLWRAMLRGTITGLLANAAASAGVTESWFVVHVRDRKRSNYGGAPEFRTSSEIKIEISASAEIPEGTPPEDALEVGRLLAEDALDDLCELAEDALLGGQGFSVVMEVAHNSATATPESLDGLAKGMTVRGPGVNPRDPFLAIKEINEDDTVTLTAPYAGIDGAFRFNVGSFVGLFERIESVDTYSTARGMEDDIYVAREIIRVVGHVHETFEPARGPDLGGINLYADSINIFDPNGDFEGQEPFAVASAPRTAGPDGRPDIVANVDTNP